MFDDLVLTVSVMSYHATNAIIHDVTPDQRDHLIALAETARHKRNIPIHEQSMYFIRFQQPPNPRLIIALFVMDMKGQRYNVLAYYDEIEHLLKKGWENGDIQKLPGIPFTENKP